MPTRIYTSAQVYPLGEEEVNQVEKVQGVVLNAILSNRSSDLAANLRQASLGNPMFNQRRFYTEAVRTDPGRLFGADFDSAVDINTTEVVSELTLALGLQSDDTLKISETFIDDGNADYFAEGWLLENRPDFLDDAWEAAIDKINESVVIKLTGADEVIEEITISAPDDLIWSWSNQSRLLYVYYQIITQDPVTGAGTATTRRLYTYRLGSGGNATLDALASQDVAVSNFYPVYFLRRFNKSVKDFPDEYAKLKASYKALFGSSVDVLIDAVESSESIDDIDFCYLFQGVSLGTSSQTGLAYLFDFFEMLRENQTTSKAQHAEYGTIRRDPYINDRAYEARIAAVVRNDVYNPNFKAGLASAPHPEFTGQPHPQRVVFSPGESTTFDEDFSAVGQTKFRYALTWAYIDRQFYSGNAANHPGTVDREPLKKGEHWLAVGPSVNVWAKNLVKEREKREDWIKQDVQTVLLFQQYDLNRYTVLEMAGLNHENYVYEENKEVTPATEAIGNTRSPFLVPLHEPTLESFGMSQRAALASTSSYLVFNAYEIVDIPWYATKFFKIILIAASFLLPYVFAPIANLATAAGVLGTNIAVGTAIGLTGTAAIVAGAAVNMVAGILVNKFVTWGAQELLGDELGALVGAVLSFVAMNLTEGGLLSGDLSIDWTSLFTGENLLRMTDSVVSGYNHMLAIETGSIYDEIDEINTKEQEELKNIQDLWDDLTHDTTLFDPMLLTENTLDYGESRSLFLSRTLMTGGDIASLSTGYISDFTRFSLRLPDALS